MREREAKRLSPDVIDSRNATWFALQHAKDLRHSPPRGRWYVRDERWTRGCESELLRRASQTTQSIARKARLTGTGRAEYKAPRIIEAISYPPRCEFTDERGSRCQRLAKTYTASPNGVIGWFCDECRLKDIAKEWSRITALLAAKDAVAKAVAGLASQAEALYKAQAEHEAMKARYPEVIEKPEPWKPEP